MTIRVRFAPSPTGYIHVGNARMALFNYLIAKRFSGEFILRVDDTDEARVEPQYLEALYRDLQWLGLHWDLKFHQLENIEVYNSMLTDMLQKGLVYPCYETSKELEDKRKLQLANKQPPIYDRSMLNLTQNQRLQYEAQGRKPHYRLKISYKSIKWNDLIKGEIEFLGSHISDPIVVREDGTFLYLFTSVVDDISYDITHIIRGEDHVTNTAIQLQIFDFLDYPRPYMAHLPMLTDPNGKGFSKRDNSLSINHLKDQGIHPMGIHNYLFHLGSNNNFSIYKTLDAMLEAFDISEYNGVMTSFHFDQLLNINSRFISSMSYEDASVYMYDHYDFVLAENFWEILKNNIVTFSDLIVWDTICHSHILPLPVDNKELLLAIQDSSVSDIINDFSVWVGSLSRDPFVFKKRDIIMTLRKIITGRVDGPELGKLLRYMDLELINNRIKQAQCL